MNPVFINICHYSKDKVLQMTKKTMSKVFVLFYYIFGIIYLLLGITQINIDIINTLSWFIAGIVFIGLIQIIPRINANRILKRDYDMYGSTGETKTSLFEEGIVVLNQKSKGEVSYNYPIISRVIETKDLYLLVTN